MNVAFKGDSTKNKLTVKNIIKAKKTTSVKKTASSVKIKITLKGKKVYKRKTVTVKFKGKNYKIKTNNKGVAYFTITSKMISKLNDRDRLIKAACDGVSVYSLDGEHKTRFADLIKLDIEPLKKAIEKNVPLINEKFPEIINMIDEIPETYEGHKIISAERKEVYKRELATRKELILVPQYEKIHSTVSENEVHYEVTKSHKGRR